MMGPLLACRDSEHLGLILEALRGSGIEVLHDGAPCGLTYSFRRGRGVARGSCLHVASGAAVFHLGFGHPWNPLLWPADKFLLREVERAFLANGSSRVALKTLA